MCTMCSKKANLKLSGHWLTQSRLCSHTSEQWYPPAVVSPEQYQTQSHRLREMSLHNRYALQRNDKKYKLFNHNVLWFQLMQYKWLNSVMNSCVHTIIIDNNNFCLVGIQNHSWELDSVGSHVGNKLFCRLNTMIINNWNRKTKTKVVRIECIQL